MFVDQLPVLDIFGPTLIVIGLIYVLGPMLPLQQSWARYGVFAVVWAIVGRYFVWRLFETVLPANGGFVQVSWIWICFVAEAFAACDALILYIVFLRTTDRRKEADGHEARLRATPPENLPTVDVFITTYNEPLEVLEKTIVGALCLDYPRFSVWVLDDGRRPWLKTFCAGKGVGYINRPNNTHAKAGNINHAVQHSSAEYFAIFDADFIPQRSFLMRTLGFFADESVGIVQVPHAFYNHDPLQVNLALRKTLPDDQRFFFEAIMPSRDGWDAAFCCGSNSVTRRAALRKVGDGLPTGSITEDMLLTLVMLRRGYVTRYLCEHLAFGLAPESLKAFFVQRERWARGAIQMFYLREGPLGPGLSLMHRLLFLPTHWLTQSLLCLMSVVTPTIFLWTGLAPMDHVTIASSIYYIVPMVLALIGGIFVFAENKYFPLAAQALGLFQSLKILPAAIATLIRPHGLIFKVTPKGGASAEGGYEEGIFWASAIMLLLTFLGLIINSSAELRIVRQAALVPLVAFWCGINIVLLFLVCMLCLQLPVRRGEERFDLDEPAWLQDQQGGRALGRIADLSLSGASVRLGPSSSHPIMAGDQVRLYIKDVGHVTGYAVRASRESLAIKFDLPNSVERDLLIRKLFTSGLETAAVTTSVWSATAGMIQRIWMVNSRIGRVSEAAHQITTDEKRVPEEKLPAQTFIMQPTGSPRAFDEIVAQRKAMAS